MVQKRILPKVPRQQRMLHASIAAANSVEKLSAADHSRGKSRAGFFASARINLRAAQGDGAREPLQSGARRCS